MSNQRKTSGITVSRLCQRLKMSRQNYYTAQKQYKRRDVQGGLLAQFTRQHRQLHPRMGCRKILFLYHESQGPEAERMGRDRAFEELGHRELLVARKKGKPKTTQSYHNLPICGNRIAALAPDSANQVWVSDLTYLDTREGPAYLSLITDKVARKIQGYHVSEDLKTTGCLKALQMAQEKLPAGQHPIHHSDRGCQYASRAYAEALASRQMPSSMTEKNHCAENALAERMNGILKQEYGLDERFATMSQAREAVEQAIYLYNEKRPHTALDYQTPSAKYQASQAEAGNSWRPAPFRLTSLASTAPVAMN